jgi:ribosomal protein S18 acetylase RimI-like enzyme
VYREGSVVLGYICFGPHSLTEGTYDIYWIAVSPEAHQRGIGSRLLHEAEEEIAGKGGRKVLIETSSSPLFSPARALYAHCGYQVEAVVHDFYQDGDDLLIFSKRLRENRRKPMEEIEVVYM